MEQVAQLKSLSDTIEKLKVSSHPALLHSTELTSEHPLVELGRHFLSYSGHISARWNFGERWKKRWNCLSTNRI
jgi:hypothetical protein